MGRIEKRPVNGYGLNLKPCIVMVFCWDSVPEMMPPPTIYKDILPLDTRRNFDDDDIIIINNNKDERTLPEYKWRRSQKKSAELKSRFNLNKQCWTFLLLLLLGLHFKVCEAVKIVRMSVPRWVENGTVDSVILDCEYTFTETDELLVVKWFLDSDPEPIYQWITEYNTRHVSARLQGHLNINFMVTPSNSLTRYRALNIMRPTTDLSGKYSCHVVSLRSQDTADQVMTVYAAPKRLEFNYTRSTALGANLTCEAEEVFPIPRILLYRLTVYDSEPQLIFDVNSHFEKTNNGGFEAIVSHEILDRSLPPTEPVSYECIFSLPGTTYQRQKKIIYYPGSAIDNASSNRAQLLLAILALIAIRRGGIV